MHAPLLDPSGWDDNCRRIVDSGGEWILGVLFPPFSFENRLLKTDCCQDRLGTHSKPSIGGFAVPSSDGLCDSNRAGQIDGGEEGRAMHCIQPQLDTRGLHRLCARL